jgi:uncharacterized protein YjbI with pentapeptide repeats
MTEITNSNQNTPESQPAKPVRTFEALLEFYQQGHRNFSGSDLRAVTVKTLKLELLDKGITYVNLREIILTGSNLTAVMFRENANKVDIRVDLTGSNLQNCDLRLADLSQSILNQCNFSNSDLRGVRFSGSSCRGSDLIKANLQKIGYSSLDGDFTASNFTSANFSGSTLSGNFKAANFSGANLHSVKFHGFSSDGADFSDADLQNITFTSANLKYCYYNSKTKFSDKFDPFASGMELIKDESESEGY